FATACAPCHGDYADDGHVLRYDDTPTPLAEIGTDPARALAPTDDFVAAANDPSVSHGVTRTHRTGGYIAPGLTRPWARAPYGHAGQWPSLAVLATPPDQRAARWRGVVFDVAGTYDLTDVGLAHRAGGAAPGPFEITVDDPRISPAGHRYLSDLGADAR